jgi:hypothetical protein
LLNLPDTIKNGSTIIATQALQNSGPGPGTTSPKTTPAPELSNSVVDENGNLVLEGSEGGAGTFLGFATKALSLTFGLIIMDSKPHYVPANSDVPIIKYKPAEKLTDQEMNEIMDRIQQGTGSPQDLLYEGAIRAMKASSIAKKRGTELTDLFGELNTDNKTASQFFGWGSTTNLTKSINDFTKEGLLSHGWNKQNLVRLAIAYNHMYLKAANAGSKNGNPAAIVRRNQAMELARHFFGQ